MFPESITSQLVSGPYRPKHRHQEQSDIRQAIEHSEPFKGRTTTGIREGDIYLIFVRERLIYRLNCLTGAYSFDTVLTGNGTDQRIIDTIRKVKGIHATPIEEAIIKDTRGV